MKLEIPVALSAIKATSRVYRRGSSLYRQGDISKDYFVVLEGWVALSIVLEDGARHISDFAMPGAFLGLQLASGAAFSHSAHCVTPVCVYCFPRDKVDELVEREPRLANFLLFETASQAARANDHLVNITCREARGRIAHLLVELFYRTRQRFPTIAGDSFPLPLTLQQIGDAIGLTDVHVSRTLRILRENQIIRLQDRTLTVLNPRELSAAAGFDEHRTYQPSLFRSQAPTLSAIRPHSN